MNTKRVRVFKSPILDVPAHVVMAVNEYYNLSRDDEKWWNANGKPKEVLIEMEEKAYLHGGLEPKLYDSCVKIIRSETKGSEKLESALSELNNMKKSGDMPKPELCLRVNNNGIMSAEEWMAQNRFTNGSLTQWSVSNYIDKYMEYYHAEISKDISPSDSCQSLESLFANKADAYLNTIDESVEMGMSKERFVEVVSELKSNKHSFPYLKIELDGQIEKFKKLGINTTGQTFEQMVNSAISMLEHAEESKQEHAIEFLDSIREYERESGDSIWLDERSSEDLYESFKYKHKS